MYINIARETRCDLEPSHVEEELEKSEERKDEVSSVTTAWTLLQRLTAHQTCEEEQVDRHGHNLDSTATTNETQGPWI